MSEMFKRLRAEAERASQSNLLMMAATKNRDPWSIADQYSGQTLKTRLQVGGMTVSAGSMVGLMGLAVANQAAALGTSSLLATASTAMAGLGAVSVGTAVLPVATVVALGGAVAGLAVAAVGKLLNVDHDKGAAITHALQHRDDRGLQAIGRSSLGLGDWFQGARQAFSSSMLQSFFGSKAPEVEASQRMNASVEYEVIGLFSHSPLEAQQGRAALAAEITGEMWDRYGVVVDEISVHSALGNTRDGSTSTGKVVAVDHERGLVVQSTGRGRATVHTLSSLEKMPAVGEEMNLRYQRGSAVSIQQRAPGQAVGLGR